MASTKPIAVQLKPGHYYIALGSTAVIHFLPYAFQNHLGGIHLGDHFTLWNSYWLYALLGAYDIASVRRVRTNQSAGITVLERESIETGRGPKFVPYGFASLHSFPRAMQEDQFPSDPENILRKPENGAFPPGMYEPMRIPTGGPDPTEDDSDMLDVRLTLEPTVSVIWQVVQKGFFDFYINIDGDTWPEKRAFLLKQMRDTVETQLLIEFKDRTVSKVQKDVDTIIKNVQDVLADKVADWGISICSVNIQNLKPPKATSEAMEEVPRARARRTAAMHDAEGAKQSEIIRSEGQLTAASNLAKARETMLTAEGTGTMGAAKALGMSGSDYTASLVAREALGKGDVILGAEGIAQAVGLGKLIFGKT
jgi:hypothetical protein